MKFKKDFFGLVAILVITGLAAGIWYWRDAAKRAALESELQKIEEQISATEKRLQELSRLTPEEIAKSEAELEILSAKTAAKDVQVDGIEVVTAAGKKIIKNFAQHYTIEVPPNLLVARSIAPDWLELYDPEIMCEGDPLCSPILRIVVSTEDIKDILSQLASYETINIGGEIVYKVTEKIPTVFEGSYYYWFRDGKVYSIRISSFDESTYYKYIETFRFG